MENLRTFTWASSHSSFSEWVRAIGLQFRVHSVVISTSNENSQAWSPSTSLICCSIRHSPYCASISFIDISCCWGESTLPPLILQYSSFSARTHRCGNWVFGIGRLSASSLKWSSMRSWSSSFRTSNRERLVYFIHRCAFMFDCNPVDGNNFRIGNQMLDLFLTCKRTMELTWRSRSDIFMLFTRYLDYILLCLSLNIGDRNQPFKNEY